MGNLDKLKELIKIENWSKTEALEAYKIAKEIKEIEKDWGCMCSRNERRRFREYIIKSFKIDEGKD